MRMWLKIQMLLVVALVIAAECRAQVDKQVEVTKAYVPTLEQADKLAIRPDMTDTMQLRPEIDYTVTPLSLQTTLATRPMRPAQVTYWEFNRPKPFYVKAGLGYPLQSVGDFYVSTQNPGTGYAMGYVNHAGRYADIKDDEGLKKSTLRMENRIGGSAGKYLGKHLVEGQVNYTHRTFTRYGTLYPEAIVSQGDRVGYADLGAEVRVGDDFQDLTRTNFEIVLDGTLFYDHSDWIDGQSRGDQNEWGVRAHVGRALKKYRLDASIGYRRMAGDKALEGCNEQLVEAALRYVRRIEQLSFEVGVDYCYDRIQQTERKSEHYVFPYLHFEFDLLSDAVKPFIEVDGALQHNDFRSLAAENPYLQRPLWLMQSTPEWEGRGGLTGHSKNHRFTYRAFLAYAYRDNNRYWLLPVLLDGGGPQIYEAGLGLHVEQQKRFTLGGEVEYRPTTAWLLDGAVRFYAYEDQHKLENGMPEWEASVGVRYEGRKVRVALRAAMMGERYWSTVAAGEQQITEHTLRNRCYEAPSAVDLQFDFEWRMSGSMALFVEGRNLLNADLYRWPTMPEYGINALAGVRLTF